MKINLENILEENGKSQYWLAKKTGITVQNLSKLRKGQTSSIAFSVLEKICNALDCTPNDILIIERNDD